MRDLGLRLGLYFTIFFASDLGYMIFTDKSYESLQEPGIGRSAGDLSEHLFNAVDFSSLVAGAAVRALERREKNRKKGAS